MPTPNPTILRMTIAGVAAEPTRRPELMTEPLVLTSAGRVSLQTTRGVAAVDTTFEVPRDGAVCLRLAGGFEWWLSAEEASRLFAADGSRGSAGADDAVSIDPRRVLRRRASRGADEVDFALESLEWVGIDLAGKTAKEVGLWAENKVLHQDGPGVYRLSLGDQFVMDRLPDDQTLPGEKPLLVFIHGTGSSTEGSFGELWAGDNADSRAAREALRKNYGSRVFALEHRTLTESPIDNALALARRLPPGAELHLVTHSRGGLVGDLLCLGQRQGDVLSKERLDELFAKDRTLAEIFGLTGPAENGYPAQRERIDALLSALDLSKPTISRYVRAACPALGTTLGSGKLDRWLSVLRFVGGPATQSLLAFLLAVIKEHTDPRSLPGLEAMMPGSALVRLLNLPDLRADADLTVIAGDIEGDSKWGKLKLVLADLFFVGDHDLVVNTGSMYGGARRVKAGRFFFDRGPKVCHFRYFKNKATVDHLVFGLLDPEAAGARFQALSESQRVEPARAKKSPVKLPADAPIAIVLPGIMGSHLKAADRRVWLNLGRIATGGFDDLRIDAEEISTDGVFERYYGDFVEFLRNTHEVEVFAYDWRLSVRDSAEQLAALLENRLVEAERNKRSVHIVAHSMGGLVVRAMLAQQPTLWQRLKSLAAPARFRLLMLGTPNRGSYQAVRLMVGQHFLVNMMALADLRHSGRELLKIINRYPGAAELLPWRHDDYGYADPAFWQKLDADTDESWPVPDGDALAAARKTWQLLQNAPSDRECMSYVAGGAERTAIDYKVEQGLDFYLPGHRRIVFYSTQRGDGTVPWDLGCLADVDTWYATGVSHDQLLAHRPYFPAYLDLLQTGATSRLSNTEPAGVRGLSVGEDRLVMPPDLPPYLPTEGDFGGFGGAFARFNPAAGDSLCAALPPTKVSICHGDLAYSRYPVCVGHYHGDTQVSAEHRLDGALGGVLSSRMRLGIYPGRIGTWEVFIAGDPATHPAGALVLGLGQVGQLTPGALAGAMSRMLMDYALQVANWRDDRFGASDGIRSARISTLLIGTGAGGFTVRDSVTAILQAVKTAKEGLAKLSPSPRVCIDEVEILEIYADVAVQAARALGDALAMRELAEGFQWSDQSVKKGTSGLARATYDEAPDWWRRIEITEDMERDGLLFLLLTEHRARAPQSLSSGQIRLATAFVASIQRTTRGDGELGRTLYEMLIPNALKEMAPDRRDTVLVVDQRSARFPWEMLDDRWSDAGPLAVAAGLLRQLKTTEFRSAPLQTRDRTAFVVGTPKVKDKTKFPDLPGARKEATAVAIHLREQRFLVETAIDADHQAIMRGLHGRAWRILHLAGHGVHDEDVAATDAPETCDACAQNLPQPPRLRSGMVIGDGMILTPGDIEQLRWVPELVFINCCHLGTTTPSALPDFGGLAANLAVQFIKMGVRAVIAAGWAVDDAPAKRFAEEFYAAMGRGVPFGQAVLLARRSIRSAYPDCNTWGAYQCYGDPHYSLDDDGGIAGANPPLFRSADELIAGLDNLTARARSNHVAPSEIDGLLERVQTAHRKEWLGQADVATSLGLAYGEVRDFAKGIEYLDLAAKGNKARISVSALEQRANFKTRRALQLARSNEGGAANALFDQGQKELELLLEIGRTFERCNLMGSLWKRRAMVADDAARTEYLGKMEASYREAAERSGNDRAHAAYSKVNQLLAQFFRRLFNEGTDLDTGAIGKMAEDCLRLAIECRMLNHSAPDLWVALDEGNALLTAALAKNDLRAERDRILAIYRGALRRGASQAQVASVLDQIGFIDAMLMPVDDFLETRRAVADIEQTLRYEFGQDIH